MEVPAGIEGTDMGNSLLDRGKLMDVDALGTILFTNYAPFLESALKPPF
jgi:hypothetical protein